MAHYSTGAWPLFAPGLTLLEPSAHRPCDFVPWRFSAAGKHRVQLQYCDPASEKPAHQLPEIVHRVQFW
jgi:hypothetical protein